MANQAALAAPEDQHVAGGAYAFLGFVTFLNVLNFVDRQLLASFANFIKPDLGLTDTQFGLLTGFAFIVFYAAMGLIAGTLADRLHRPRLMAAALAMWSALTAVSGAARGFVSLGIPRMLIGVGESVLAPSAMSMLSERFPATKLGLASGIYYLGVPIGVGASLLIAGYLGPAIGWRNCFYILGAIGIVFAVVMWFVPETKIRQARNRIAAGGGAEAAKVAQPKFKDFVPVLVKALTASPALVFTICGGVALHFILGAAAFEQLWFVQERGFDRAEIAQISGYIGIVGGVLGNLFGGWGGDRFQARTGQGRPMFLVWILVLFMPVMFVYRFISPENPIFYIGIFIGFFQLGCFYGPTFSTVQELVPPQIRATIIAFYILVLNLVGLGIGISGAGIAIDMLRASGVEQPYTWTLFVFTLISGLAIPFFYLAGKRYARDKAALFERIQAEGV